MRVPNKAMLPKLTLHTGTALNTSLFPSPLNIIIKSHFWNTNDPTLPDH
ncbi:hypothetical protein CH59_4376 (plasmid) [Yersinia pestis]|nr:hypothetical protein CH59_4376 [Yersinia pestis]AJK06071.1 hypothetical protein CH55_4268 [Yersinia pestis]